MDTQEPIPQEAVATTPSFVVPVNKILSRSFAWMALGLAISLITSFAVALTPALVHFIIQSSFGFFALILIELGIVMYISRRIQKISSAQAKLLFVIYAIVSGSTLSVIFFAFNMLSILSIFFGAAIFFGALAIYGAHTTTDLTKAGRLAMFGLLGLVFAMIFNFFIGGTKLELIISWIGVAIFTVLTAYDVQKLKRMAGTVASSEDIGRATVIGALTLYLDFINIFLFLLRIFGRRK